MNLGASQVERGPENPVQQDFPFRGKSPFLPIGQNVALTVVSRRSSKGGCKVRSQSTLLRGCLQIELCGALRARRISYEIRPHFVRKVAGLRNATRRTIALTRDCSVRFRPIVSTPAESFRARPVRFYRIDFAPPLTACHRVVKRMSTSEPPTCRTLCRVSR